MSTLFATRGAVLLALSLATFSCTSTTNVATNEPTGVAPPPATVASSAAPLPHPAITRARLDGSPASLADIAQRAVQSVVNVSSTKTVRLPSSPFFSDPFFRFFFPQQPFGSPPRPQEKQQSQGSGVLIDDGVIVTNNHVVEGADEVKMTMFVAWSKSKP